MHPRSRLLVIDGVLPDRGDPDRAIYVANRLSLFLMFGSRLRDLGEFTTLLEQAKFTLTDRRAMPTDMDFCWNILFAEPCDVHQSTYKSCCFSPVRSKLLLLYREITMPFWRGESKWRQKRQLRKKLRQGKKPQPGTPQPLASTLAG